MRFYPFVFTGKDPCKGWRGVPAEFDEEIPLNKIKYNEHRDEESGCGYIGPLGGRYQNYYKYDPLHRLIRAGGSNQYGFEQAFELSRAGRPLSMSTNGMVKHYAYGEHTPPHAPQRIMVEEGFRHTLHDLRWDPAGNLGQVSTLAHDRGDVQSRFLFWTEDSRLHTVVDDRHHSYYAYDHAGGSCGSRAQSQACLSYAEMEQRRRSQRTLKVTGRCDRLDINAWILHTVTSLRDHTVYPSPYVVLSNHGYTKHYYAGSERLAARLGGGFDRPILREQTDIAMTATHLFKQSQHHTNDRHLNAPPAHTIRREGHLERVFRGMEIEFAIPEAVRAEVHLDPEGLIQAAQNIVSDNTEPDVYFYHSDHLGSASWITDAAGTPIQHLQYLPYGEPFVNQRAAGSTYSERFRFTGKERDAETGFGYFGARYMDHELMTMWLSVDPLADKYPNISPYNYCMWNPMKLVDPDGNDVVASDDWYKNKETGAVFWREGHAESITLNGDTYDNIGESYSYLMADGQHVNYFQNCPLTIGQERDVTPLAYEDQSCRTSLIRTRSVLPDSHKKDLFNSHVASRGVLMPDMIGIQFSGSAVVGGGYTMDITFGFVKDAGLFCSVAPGASCGFDVSIGFGLCIGRTSSATPSRESLNGLSYTSAIGYGSAYFQYSHSALGNNKWKTTSYGISLGSTTVFGGTAGIMYSF